MADKNKIRELLARLDALPTKEVGDFADQIVSSKMKGLTEELRNDASVAKMNEISGKLDQFKTEFNLAPLSDALDEINQTIADKETELKSLIDQKGIELTNAQQASDAVNGQITDQLSSELEALRTGLGSLSDPKNSIEELRVEFKSLADSFTGSQTSFQSSLDETKGLIPDIAPLSDSLATLGQNIESVRADLLQRIASIGGGQANRNIKFSGSVLTRYTDLNFLGTSYTNNDTTKMADVTFPAGGGGGGSPTIGGAVIGGSDRAVLFIHPSSVLSQDVNNFSFQDNATTPQALATNTNVALSINTGGDTTGTDAVNIYAQIDAYLPNSAITNSLTGFNTDGAFPGFTASSSQGTGISPTISLTGDAIGGFSGWGYTGGTPSYQNLGGMMITAVGTTSTNLGGQLDFYTKANNGSLIGNLSLLNNGQLVQHSAAAANGFALYNTVDEVTNFEKGELNWNANVLTLATSNGGTGTARNLVLMGGARTFTISAAGTSAGNYIFSTGAGSGIPGVVINGGFSNSTGTAVSLQISPTITGTSTAAYTGLLINPTFSSSGSSSQLLADFQTGSVSHVNISSAGTLTIQNNITAAAWTTNGTQLAILAATLSDNTSAAGTVTTSVANGIGIPTFTTPANAVTYTNGATLYIAGAPINGTNVTITNKYSLLVAGGSTQFNGTLTVGGLSALTGGFSSATGGSFTANFFANAAAGISAGISAASFLFAGASTIMARAGFSGNTSTALGAGNSYTNVIVASSPATTSGSAGVHALLANMVVNPLGTITASVGTVTNTASLYINGAATATVTGANYGLWVNSADSRFDGNVILGTAGNKITIATGSNASAGQATLVGGTVTVNTTAVTASSLIFLTDATTGALTNVGSLTVGTKTAGVSFVINSTNPLDTSNVNYFIIN